MYYYYYYFPLLIVKFVVSVSIKYYEIEKDVFITGVYHKNKNNYILLDGYTTHKKVNIYSCKVYYDYKNISCSPKYSKRKKLDNNYFVIEIKYNKKIKPKCLILNNFEINIPHKLYNHYKYVVCTSVMYNYTAVNYLIQRMESLKYFGVSKVVIYNIHASIEIKKILRQYIREGFLDLYKYDDHIENDIWRKNYYGQVWKLNHCFHTYQENSEYIINSDLDEVIWPVNSNSYDELFKTLPKSDVYYFDARFIFTTKDYNVKLKDVDMFNISDSCTVRKGYCKKYIIASPLKYYGISVHTLRYHDWFTKETKVKMEYAYIRHTKKITKTLEKLCKNHQIIYKDNKTMKIENKVKRQKKNIFSNSVYL